MILNDEDFQDFVQTDRGQTMLTQVRRIIKEEAALREENGEIVNENSVNSSNRKHNVVKKGKPRAISKEQLLKARELFKSRGLADVTDAQIMEILRSKDGDEIMKEIQILEDRKATLVSAEAGNIAKLRKILADRGLNDISDEDIEQLVKSEKGADLLRQIGVVEEDQASIEKAKNQNLGDLKEILKANGMDNLSDSDLSELLTTEYGQQILKSYAFHESRK